MAGVSQAAGGTLAAATLQSGGVAGSVDLAGTSNNITTLGSVSVSGGDFSLVNNGNSGNLAVVGPVTANNVAISNASTGCGRSSSSPSIFAKWRENHWGPTGES